MVESSFQVADSRRAKERALAEFDSWSKGYDRSILNYLLFRPSHMVMLEEIARWRQGRDGPFRVLDIGCGTATFACLLLSSAWPVDVAGLDYSPGMCEAAARKVRATGAIERAWITRGDSEHLPFDSGSFDVVTCANSFHHYPHQAAVVCEMHRVLRPGGRLILIDGFRDNVIGWFVFDVCVTRIEKDVHHATWREMRGYLEQAGFADVVQHKTSVLAPFLTTVGTK